MIIYIHLFPPFSNATGKKRMTIEIEQSKILFKELLDVLIDEYPKMRALFPTNIINDNFYGNCYTVDNGRLLKLDDYITDGAVISIYGSLSGG